MKKLCLFFFSSLVFFACNKSNPEIDPPVDTSFPEISDLSRNIDSPKPTESVVISAKVTVTETAPLNSVVLSWKVNDVSKPNITMNKGGNGIYSATLSAQAEGALVTYTVTATNNNGNTKESGAYVVSTIPLDYTQLALNEINGNGDDSQRYIELYNKSARAIPLRGVTIYYNSFDSKPALTWTGKDEVIQSKSFLLLKGSKNTGDLTTGLSPTQGIVVEMFDPYGDTIDYFIVDEDGFRKDSYSRIPDGTGKWYFTYFVGTPGKTNGTSGSTPIPTIPIIYNLTRNILVPKPSDAVTVSAIVKPAAGTTLSSVVLKWSSGGVSKSNITMTKNNDVYSATIPSQVTGTLVEYTVFATNNESKSGEISAKYTVMSQDMDYMNLVINEIDGNGKFVEIFNKGNVAVSLEKVNLVKNGTQTWWTGASAVIVAKGYYTIAESGGASGANEYTGKNGISAKQNLKFELKTPDDKLIDSFLRSNGGELGGDCTPDYGFGTPYSFSRCPDGTGAFGLATPSCNKSNPATSAGPILAQ